MHTHEAEKLFEMFSQSNSGLAYVCVTIIQILHQQGILDKSLFVQFFGQAVESLDQDLRENLVGKTLAHVRRSLEQTESFDPMAARDWPTTMH